MIRPFKAVVLHASEMLVALGAVLLFFLIFMAILGLSFPEGTTLGSLVFPDTSEGATTNASRIDLEMADPETFIAVLSQAHRSVKNKPADAIAWADARTGMALGQRHSVQTLERSGAVISFGGEDRLVLKENSLVVIREMTRLSRQNRRRTSVVALEGGLHGRIEKGQAGDENLEIEVVTANGTTRILPDEAQGADFDVTVNPDDTSTFSVRSGTAQVTSAGKTVTLRPNQTITVERSKPPGRPVVLPDPPALVQPQDGATLAFRSMPPEVLFAWNGETDAYRLEIGRDQEFNDVVHEQDVPGAEFVHGNLPAGRYYWRVTSLAGWAVGKVGGSRTLNLVRDTEAPGLEVTFPEDRVPTTGAVLQGVAEPGAQVFVSDEVVPLEASGSFEYALNLEPGLNLVVVEAVDAAGNITYRSELVNATYERSLR